MDQQHQASGGRIERISAQSNMLGVIVERSDGVPMPRFATARLLATVVQHDRRWPKPGVGKPRRRFPLVSCG